MNIYNKLAIVRENLAKNLGELNNAKIAYRDDPTESNRMWVQELTTSISALKYYESKFMKEVML